MTNQKSISMSKEVSSIDKAAVDEAASGDEVETAAQPRRLPKGKLEIVAMVIMAIGFLMIFQPVSILLYNYSFIVIIIGTLMFIIVSHFPDEE